MPPRENGIIGSIKVAIFSFIFKSILILILGFRVVNPIYIPFLISLKISYKLVPKSILLNKKGFKKWLL